MTLAMATGIATLHTTTDWHGLKRSTRCLDCRLEPRSCATGPWRAIPSLPRLLLNVCGCMRSAGSWASSSTLRYVPKGEAIVGLGCWQFQYWRKEVGALWDCMA